VQSVLCDALAAPSVPDLEVVPRWLSAIARNKVADFHRERTRRAEMMLGEPSAVDPIEERDLLGRAASIAPDPRALEWIVRVEQGESLAEIARSERVPAPAVRQRVSRLRRVLRAALLVAAALAVFFVVRSSKRVAIRPDAAHGSVDGRWRVASVQCPPSAPTAACDAAPTAHVRIVGNTATVELRGASLAIDIADALREYHGRMTPSGTRLFIQSDLGSVTLERE